ncbi:MAG: AMMECR1 family protein, partial [Chitinivibrionia bacterium]|nr:AMMECR1 family protein [Chitinivibrionia bacterium]
MRSGLRGMFAVTACAVIAVGLCVMLSGEDKAPAAADGGKDKYEVWERLTDAEGAWLVDFARKSVATKLGVMKEEPTPPKDMPHLIDKRGVFVTINKHGKLRGCIGVYSSKDSLWKQVWMTAQDSAFMDPRFDKVLASELDKLEFEVSVFLCPVTKIKGPEDFIVGKHGIFIR